MNCEFIKYTEILVNILEIDSDRESPRTLIIDKESEIVSYEKAIQEGYHRKGYNVDFSLKFNKLNFYWYEVNYEIKKDNG